MRSKSRTGGGLSVIAILVWLVYYRSFSYQWRLLFKYLWIGSLILLIGMSNPSFSRVTRVAYHRYESVFTPGAYDIEKKLSLATRTREILNTDLTPFGDRSDGVRFQSQLARTTGFYGVIGVLSSIAFWMFYARLVRFSYLGIGLVVVLAGTGLAKWTFDIEGFVTPVVFITALLLQSRPNEPRALCDDYWGGNQLTPGPISVPPDGSTGKVKPAAD